MAEESVITQEMRDTIGIESDATIVLIEKEPIRRFAEAIGDNNPVYHDEDYAKKCGYRSIIAPPGFNPSYSFQIKKGKTQEGQDPIRSKFTRGLNGGGEYESFHPIQAGDVISITHKISDIYERDGRMGKMVFVVSETIYRNEKAEILLIQRTTGIRY